MTVVTDDDGAAGVTFEAFARILGRSRPYVSALVKNGRITPPALTPDRKIIPDLAQAQIAEGADPARAAGGKPSAEADGTYATQRARMVAAQAERAELDLQERRGELIQRTMVADVVGAALRKMRDDLVAVPRDIVLDPEQATRCQEAIAAVLERTSAEILNHGGGSPAQ